MPKPITTVEPKVMPDPKLEKRTRRIFTAEYKLSILQQADACKHGELGALLRREKLYSNGLLPARISECQACDALDVCGNSIRGARRRLCPKTRLHFIGKEVELFNAHLCLAKT